MKVKTLSQVEGSKAKAVRFVRDVLGDEDRAAEIEEESPESYAERKRIRIMETNPKRSTTMATAKPTRADLEQRVEELEAENQELVDKLDSIADVINDDDSDEEDGEEEDDE
jgi:hypothetical protein